jgi:hypothetical protein
MNLKMLKHQTYQPILKTQPTLKSRMYPLNQPTHSTMSYQMYQLYLKLR